MNPLDRNHDGKVDLKDLSNQNSTTAPTAHHNPLDRNHDGRVNLQDLKPGQPGYNQGLNQGVHHNPLDRNHDGRVDAADLVGGQTVYVQSARRASVTRSEPTIIETIQKDVVVHERIHPVQKEEIQPIIYREREQLDVKQVTQMMHETQIQPTLVHQRELPAERREAIVERGAVIQENYHAPTTVVDATLRTQVVHAPIINEVIKKAIIEEIQPVLERDIIQSTVIQNTQPIYEKFVEAPTVYREVQIVSTDRGITGGSLEALAAQGFNLGTFTNGTTGFAGTTSLPLGTTTTTTTTSHSIVNNAGNRRSLSEALPASYTYLNQGTGLSTDAKIVEAELLNNRNVAGAPLATKPLL